MNKGFTLIEVLVVILIVGILAAVALPQYEKAVLKSRVTQGLVALNALEKAQTEYELANGTYAQDLEGLSIDPGVDLSCGGGGNWCQVGIGSGLALEWVWHWEIPDEKHRCLACGNATAEAVCASFGGRMFRDSGSCRYYTMP